MKDIFSLFKVSILLIIGIHITGCTTNTNNKDLNHQPEQVSEQTEETPTQATQTKISPEQMQIDRENACNVQLSKLEINRVVCAESAKVLTNDRDMSEWMSGIKISYRFKFDRDGTRLPQDEAYIENIKAFYKAHGQDMNDERSYPSSAIVSSPIAHTGSKSIGQVPVDCDLWCKSTLAVKVDDIQDIRRFIIDWESRTKGESQAEADVRERSDDSVYGQFRAIRHHYDKSFSLF